jgi:hypothetical protein
MTISFLFILRYRSLKLNNRKTSVYTPGSPKSITGLAVIGKNSVKVPRKIKRITRSLIFQLSQLHKDGVAESEDEKLQKKRLRGYISFIKDNEPSYLNVLILKYHNDFHLALANNRLRKT